MITNDITFLVIGEITDLPKFGQVLRFPRCAGPEQYHAAARLYGHHQRTLAAVQTPYFCLLDGGADELLPSFERVMQEYAEVLSTCPGVHIVYGDELTPTGRKRSREFTLNDYLRNHTMIHHGVLCRTATAKAIDFPIGVHIFELIVYGTLALAGYKYLPEPCYKWTPSFRGASTWPDTLVGLRESKRWLQDNHNRKLI